MKSSYLKQVRAKNPLIHNITNQVVANFSANGLLAIGASPLMSAAVDEMEELASISSALLINIGTLNGTDPEAMLIAGKAANAAGIPVVLDPVGVGATAYRRATVERLLQEVRFSVIRGNAGEIATLANVAWEAKGVDAGKGSADLAALAQQVAKRYQSVVAISGVVDFISDGEQVLAIHNGSTMLPKITGSGCLLGSICAAFTAVASGQIFTAICEACTAYALAGELAATNLNSTAYGQFQMHFLDELGALTAEKIDQLANIEWVKK